MFRLIESVGDRRRREEIGRPRIKASLPIRINVHRRRKDQMHIFGDAARHHHLKIVGKVSREIVVAFNAGIS